MAIPFRETLLEFRAGKMLMDGSIVRPDPRKGLVKVLRSEDSLTHFQWLERGTGEVEDHFIVFPDEAVFEKVPQARGRVFLLRFPHDQRKTIFFWMQEPKADDDDFILHAVNTHLNKSWGGEEEEEEDGEEEEGGGGANQGAEEDADVSLQLPSSSSIPSDGDGDIDDDDGEGNDDDDDDDGGEADDDGGNDLQQRQGGDDDDDDELHDLVGADDLMLLDDVNRENLFREPSTQAQPVAAAAAAVVQLADLRRILSGLGHIQVPPPPPPLSSPAPPPPLSSPPPPAALSSSLSCLSSAASAAVAAAAIACNNIFQASQAAEEDEDGGPTLREILNPDSIVPLLENPLINERLMPYLPEGMRTAEEIKDLIRSPQFQQQLESFTQVIQRGQIDLSQFGIDPSKYGPSVESFLQAIEDQEAQQAAPPSPPPPPPPPAAAAAVDHHQQKEKEKEKEKKEEEEKERGEAKGDGGEERNEGDGVQKSKRSKQSPPCEVKGGGGRSSNPEPHDHSPTDRFPTD